MQILVALVLGHSSNGAPANEAARELQVDGAHAFTFLPIHAAWARSGARKGGMGSSDGAQQQRAATGVVSPLMAGMTRGSESEDGVHLWLPAIVACENLLAPPVSQRLSI